LYGQGRVSLGLWCPHNFYFGRANNLKDTNYFNNIPQPTEESVATPTQPTAEPWRPNWENSPSNDDKDQHRPPIPGIVNHPS
jgi:hypothetical protein